MNSNFITSNNWNSENTNYHKKDLAITIFSAFAMEQNDIDTIVKIVAKKYNFTPYPIIFQIDESLIGGVKVVFDSKVIDGSIKAKLNQLKEKSEERN